MVAPFTGAWIEMCHRPVDTSARASLPSRERGLKSHPVSAVRAGPWSLPSRERGLKLVVRNVFKLLLRVAPFTGAWIEILAGMRNCILFHVAPFTGAWIEIINHGRRPSENRVAPFTGAWIEIGYEHQWSAYAKSRSLHGSVD